MKWIHSSAIDMADAQTDLIYFEITDSILRSLSLGINLEFWEETDTHDEPSIETCLHSLDVGFATTFMRYKNFNNVICILREAKPVISRMCLVQMNLPFPNDVHTHIHAVATNCVESFFELYGLRFREAIIKTENDITIIQTKWRRSNSDPKHPVCRRRLLKEFDELTRSHRL